MGPGIEYSTLSPIICSLVQSQIKYLFYDAYSSLLTQKGSSFQFNFILHSNIYVAFIIIINL